MINESKNTLSPKMVSFMLVKHCNTSRFALPDLRNGTSGQSSGGGVVQRHPQDFDLMMIISLVVLLLLFSFYILWYIYIYFYHYWWWWRWTWRRRWWWWIIWWTQKYVKCRRQCMMALPRSISFCIWAGSTFDLHWIMIGAVPVLLVWFIGCTPHLRPKTSIKTLRKMEEDTSTGNCHFEVHAWVDPFVFVSFPPRRGTQDVTRAAPIILVWLLLKSLLACDNPNLWMPTTMVTSPYLGMCQDWPPWRFHETTLSIWQTT